MTMKHKRLIKPHPYQSGCHLNQRRSGACGMTRRVGRSHRTGLTPPHGATLALQPYQRCIEFIDGGICHPIRPILNRQIMLIDADFLKLHKRPIARRIRRLQRARCL